MKVSFVALLGEENFVHRRGRLLDSQANVYDQCLELRFTGGADYGEYLRANKATAEAKMA